ncbi:MAG: hypothetical protein Q7T11_04620, partial [Deltaproteobacteria bacterium]|nr:hypothetical protein [Deltaproteobacteria bacterium]
MKFFKITILLILAACQGGGGTEAGNPPAEVLRAVTGTLPSEETGCAGDLVTATDSSGTTFEATPDSDCTFTLNLPVGKAYTISF